eukprot:GHVS01075385.1.p1 GENE.GHVS01075385.1~~GHVS01075385.1.p1  ORF type:complete len:298 (+),score=35.92 GHVS01075385.1:210-1103(+)
MEYFPDDSCAVCLDVLSEACTLKCSHSFCKPCLENVKQCPLCRVAIEVKLVVKKRLQNKINKKTVSCRVCQESLSLRAATEHACYKGIPLCDENLKVRLCDENLEPIPRQATSVRPPPVTTTASSPKSKKKSPKPRTCKRKLAQQPSVSVLGETGPDNERHQRQRRRDTLSSAAERRSVEQRKAESVVRGGDRRASDTTQRDVYDVDEEVSFECPICSAGPFGQEVFAQHIIQSHRGLVFNNAICGICSSFPWCPRDYRVDDLVEHVRRQHLFFRMHQADSGDEDLQRALHMSRHVV